jgi:hypothetical protein
MAGILPVRDLIAIEAERVPCDSGFSAWQYLKSEQNKR